MDKITQLRGRLFRKRAQLALSLAHWSSLFSDVDGKVKKTIDVD